VNSGFYQALQALPPAWMFFTSDFLILGREAPSGNIPSPTDQVDDGYKTGIWLIPVSKIKQAITAQKQAQLADKVATTEKAQKDRLLKYDHNHNGIIDPDEKEEALDDPGFIKSELDKIDANKDGWLEAGELIYFDANQNKLLEPKEQAGIEIAQHQLAVQLLKKLDANGDETLDRLEFNDLFQSTFGANPRPMNARATPFPDENHDGKIDLAELESFLKQQTRKGLRTHGTPGAAFSQMRMNADQTVDPRQIFKAVLEFYWQNPGAAAPSPQSK
jgi:Ca2+-binding EF-hand superfamily protein